MPYGVCEINNTNHIISLKEKPTSNIIINTGLYIIGNKTINLIPKNKFYDFNDLISLAIEKNLKLEPLKSEITSGMILEDGMNILKQSLILIEAIDLNKIFCKN